MKKFLKTTVFILIFFLAYCDNIPEEKIWELNVNPFIGTGSWSNTFPGAIAPWGMVSLSPHNTKKRTTGYLFGEKYIDGFGHTHISGAGCADLGSVVIMPMLDRISFNPDEYKSTYDNENAGPGYYSCTLKKNKIKAEMSCTGRSGISKYIFLKGGTAMIVVDASRSLSSFLSGSACIDSDNEISGYNECGPFCQDTVRRKVYFNINIEPKPDSIRLFKSDKIIASKTVKGKNKLLGAAIFLKVKAADSIVIRTGISYISAKNAAMNLAFEQGKKSFQEIRKETFDKWEKLLSRIQVRGGSSSERVSFYTALYRMCLHPNIISDINGDYIKYGGGIGKLDSGVQYSVFSLWDTYRTLHPYLSLVFPEKQHEMMQSLLRMYKDGGWLPKWELAGRETMIMVGDPAAIVLTDSYLKGIKNIDTLLLKEALLKNSSFLDGNGKNYIRKGLKEYLKFGYIPEDYKKEFVWGSVCTSLEYCLADYCISRYFKETGNTSLADEYFSRSMNYKRLFDKERGFFRPKTSKCKWFEPFDEYATCCSFGGSGSGGPGFVEGNAYNYNFFVPYDIHNIIKLMGENRFFQRLDYIIDEQYSLWNEHSMDYPYLYALLDKSISTKSIINNEKKTQRIIRELLKKNFKNNPKGFPGHDDTGTMSAFYFFSAMGIYPYCPASNEYIIGCPLFDKITISLDTNYYPSDKLIISSEMNTSESYYIKRKYINGKQFDGNMVSHKVLTGGNELRFEMGK